MIIKSKEYKNELMEYIKEHSKIIIDMERGNLYGIMDKNSMENGSMAKRMEMAYGNLQMAIIIMDNGKIIVKQDKDNLFINLHQNIKVLSKIF